MSAPSSPPSSSPAPGGGAGTAPSASKLPHSKSREQFQQFKLHNPGVPYPADYNYEYATADGLLTASDPSVPISPHSVAPPSAGLIRVTCFVQKYDWGKKGQDSLVAQLARAGGSLPKQWDEEAKYAELWMGTHPSGPSVICDELASLSGATSKAMPLREWIAQNPETLCADPAEQAEAAASSGGPGSLPYLLKVLSIEKALSIQAHPNKARAKELFASQPQIYKDDNHKPEMTLALTDFEALLGFEKASTVAQNILGSCPELMELIEVDLGKKGLVKRFTELAGEGDSSEQLAAAAQAFKEVFSALMAAPQEDVAKRTEQMFSRLDDVPPLQRSPLENLAVRLYQQFPHDVGVFFAYLLCYRKLKPGQVVFLAANEPHAYVAGECVEVMANSDNVVRAGLTPKFKDVKELESMLTFSMSPVGGGGSGKALGSAAGPAKDGGVYHPGQLVEGEKRDDHTTVYAAPDPAVTEFQLERTVYAGDQENAPPYHLAPSTYASMLFVLEGRGEAKWESGIGRTPLGRGACFFMPANCKVNIGGKGLVLFRVTKRGFVPFVEPTEAPRHVMYRG